MAGELLFCTDPNEVLNYNARQTTTKPLDLLKYTIPGNPVSATGNLVPGTYPSPVISDGILHGNAGTIVNGATFTGTSQVAGVRFTGLVTLSPTAKVAFTTCRFDGGVAVQAVGKASFTGCHFTQPVVNAGLPANCGIVGCTRTGSPHVNVTIIYEAV